MRGFDNEALMFILSAMKAQDPKLDTKLTTEVITLSMAYDLAFMQQEGVIADGTFTDVYYDDDDAYDYIIEKLSAALPDADPYNLTEMLEAYFEFHDAYMEEIGMLNWQ